MNIKTMRNTQCTLKQCLLNKQKKSFSMHKLQCLLYRKDCTGILGQSVF